MTVPAITVDRIRKSFGDIDAVREVSFQVKTGEIFGILGPNGAGKTTTVECIAGTLATDGGAIIMLGVDPARERAFVRERVGYQLQSTALPAALRVGEALELFSTFYENPADVSELLSLVGLAEQRRRPFAKLSGGQKQRLSIALALVGNPQIAVFDELTTGLDPQGRRDVWALIRQVNERGITVVLVTHFLDEAERLCDRLAVIDAGVTRFVGTPAELIAASHATSEPWTLEDAYLDLLGGPADLTEAN
jgi:ABC-2 type transport system ATP-binding protein